MARREDNRRGKREEEENEFTDRLVTSTVLLKL